MYKLTDYVVEVLITGLDPIPNSPYHTAGSALVTYNNGPQSRFALRFSTTNKRQIKDAVLFRARGEVLDAIEALQRLKDGEPAWLRDAKVANKAPSYL
jgi:hypothetical protein